MGNKPITARLLKKSGGIAQVAIANLTPMSVFLRTDERLLFRQMVEVTLLGHTFRAQVAYVSGSAPKGALVVFEAKPALRRAIFEAMPDVEALTPPAHEAGDEETWLELTAFDGSDAAALEPPTRSASKPRRRSPRRRGSTTRSPIPEGASMDAAAEPISWSEAPSARRDRTDQVLHSDEEKTAHGYPINGAAEPPPEWAEEEGTTPELSVGSSEEKAMLHDWSEEDRRREAAPRVPTVRIDSAVVRAHAAPIPEPRLESGMDSREMTPPEPILAADLVVDASALRPITASVRLDRSPTSPSGGAGDTRPTDLPVLEADGATVRFDSAAQYRFQYRTNMAHGGIVVRAGPLPVGTQRVLSVILSGTGARYSFQARVTSTAHGTVTFAIDGFGAHRHELEALAGAP